MNDSKYVIGKMKKQPGFWSWGVSKIQYLKSGVSFCSLKLGLKVRIEVIIDKSQYHVKSTKQGLLSVKTLDQFEVSEAELSKVIDSIVYQQEIHKVA
tara:strand:+ start:7556 stop:7846 length:291 start_codon:yes stop_codon:yes gene_type:complete